MKFSSFLNSKREDCKALVAALGERFEYVSILGSDVKSTAVSVNRRSSSIGEGNLSECGFVIKMHDGRAFYEYSLDDISGDRQLLRQKLSQALLLTNALRKAQLQYPAPLTSR